MSDSSTPVKSSIHLTHRTDNTLFQAFLRHFLRALRGLILFPAHRTRPPGSAQLKPHKNAKKKCTVTERKVNDIYVYDLTLKDTPVTECAKRRIYYFAGGSWQMEPGKQQWSSCARYAEKLPSTIVSIISHPLAPKDPAPTALPQLYELYHALMHESAAAGETVVWAGDSSGANLALCLAIEGASHADVPAPAAVMAICPSTDLTRKNEMIKEINKKDPILTIRTIKNSAKAWCGEWDAQDPRVSPLFADLKPLADRVIKIHGVTAGYDLLGPDGILFRQALEKQGVEGEWLQWDKQIHVFPLLWEYGVKEGYESMDWIIDVLSRT
ncbi:alpha/beta-hydrolase [Pseudovirgaria hyperparasitica]|uniref:Alpha/beta-hydrolase n=1 Tax=Pseudovirgaria hyperparasitica TaxID=470096 RepID=A0A6A6VUI8_9PEZI|nr:alpha/beta-hydrolase [Pseudovirgaria hyperparasitica]KAF2753883.1 alpha/beta-hydrolase [Pseudovirgaria hyperparasitica]